ncbi:MAG: CDP-diacylglycerol--serine O-phosphatidyltransferase [Bryobacterales bacterium]|nr:CDP-diacylglycerol--serine O-phosphatidyltransferase [Bryobacterales bacterium]
MTWRDRLIDPRSPDRRPRRAAYALPTLFTAGNVFLGFYALIEAFLGSMAMVTDAASAPGHFRNAAVAIGWAVFLDGLDGRIARMTNTVSEFGREMDSLADSVTFGIAPAVLAFTWGVQFLDPSTGATILEYLHRSGYFLAFLYLLCGAARLARFNITKNPVPKNPGRPDRKYFVGMPIPSAAGAIAAIVYATGSEPLHSWIYSVCWLALLALLAFLMVCTWRYPSFKDLSLTQPRSPLSIILIGSFIYLIWVFSKPVLLALAITYVASGIVIRIGGVARRKFKGRPAG